MGTCGAWVNRKYADLLGDVIDKLDKHICRTYQEDGCPFATPGCQLQRGACVDRRCVGVPALPEPGPRPEPNPVGVNPGGIREIAPSP